MSCPCVGAESFQPLYSEDAETAEEKNLCLGCGEPVGDLLPISLLTPCKLRGDFHCVMLRFCDARDCQDYLDKCQQKFAADRLGLVERLSRTECTEEEVAPIRARLLNRFVVGAGRACAQCGVQSWMLRSAPGEWTNAKCGRCFRVWYCGAECQTRHWDTTHAAACVKSTRLDAPQPTVGSALAWALSSQQTFRSLKPRTVLAVYRARQLNLCSRPDCCVFLVPHCSLEISLDVVFRYGDKNHCAKGALRFCSVGCTERFMGTRFASGQPREDAES